MGVYILGYVHAIFKSITSFSVRVSIVTAVSGHVELLATFYSHITTDTFTYSFQTRLHKTRFIILVYYRTTLVLLSI